MAGYTRQSVFADDDTIGASLFNNEYDVLASTFNNQTGHAHDGTSNEGPVIGLIGDAGVVAPLNKIVVDTASDEIDVYIDVSSVATKKATFNSDGLSILDKLRAGTSSGVVTNNELVSISGTAPMGLEGDSGVYASLSLKQDTAQASGGNHIGYFDSAGTERGTVGIDASSRIYHVGVQLFGDDLGVSQSIKLFEGDTNFWGLYQYTDNTLRFNYNNASNDEFNLSSSGVLTLTTNAEKYNQLVLTQAGSNPTLYSYADNGGVGWATGAEGSYGELIYMRRATGEIVLYADSSLTMQIQSLETTVYGKLKVTGLPTSSAGLSSGELWRDGTDVKVVV